MKGALEELRAPRAAADMDDLFEAESTEIIRRSLLSRLDCTRLKLVAIHAPAGFGKSTLARQLVRGVAVSSVVDCAGVRDDLDFAQRLLPALAQESPDRTPSLIQSQLMLADEATAKPERALLALETWQAAAAPSTLIFENAEHLLTEPSAREFFVRLLGCCPNHRSIVICSREDLRLHLSRFAAPHRVAKLRAEDLTFGPDEIREIFAPLSVEASIVERVQAVSQGWPIAVLLLARFAQEKRLEALLGQLDDIAFEDIHEYLADQVLARLDTDVFEALVAAAFIPDATELDVELATKKPDAGLNFAAFERSSPFVSRSTANTFIVHPLISAMLLVREGVKRGPLLHETATAFEAAGDLIRAAELHYANQAHAEAARVLEGVPLARYHAPSMRYARVLAGLEPSLVKRHPTLWACSALLKMYSSDSAELLAETTEVWNGLSGDTPLEKRYLIFSMRVLFMSFVGRFQEALAFIEATAPRSSIPESPESPLHGYVLYLRATITARLGSIRDAEADLTIALPLVRSMDVMGSAVLMLLGAEVARTLGDRPRERDLLDRAIRATMPSDLWNVVAQRYAEAAFGAWLAGEDAVYARYGHELARMVDDNGIRGLRYFANCLRKGFLGQPQSADMPRWVICGDLIAYGDAADAEDAVRHARSAVDLSVRYGAPFLTVLAFLALAAVSDADERTDLQERARKAAALIDSPPLQSAVRDITDGRPHTGMLGAFAEKRIGVERLGAAPRLQIEVLRGAVRSGGSERTLPNRELALLFVLAVRRQTVAAESIVDQLWPDLDETAARNALSVCLHRLRQRLNDEGAIVRTRDGFQLCDEARVDLWEIRDRVPALRASGVLSAADRHAIVVLYEQLCCRMPSRIASWEWFASTERFIDELRSEAGQRLAKDAFDRGDFSEALDVAQTIIEYDPFDEPAHEIAIAAHLRMGDRAAALRRYRQYCRHLRLEFDCEPSDHVTALVRGRTGGTGAGPVALRPRLVR